MNSCSIENELGSKNLNSFRSKDVILNENIDHIGVVNYKYQKNQYQQQPPQQHYQKHKYPIENNEDEVDENHTSTQNNGGANLEVSNSNISVGLDERSNKEQELENEYDEEEDALEDEEEEGDEENIEEIDEEEEEEEVEKECDDENLEEEEEEEEVDSEINPTKQQDDLVIEKKDEEEIGKQPVYLECEWVFYYDEGVPKGQICDDWSSLIKNLGSFKTVQGFWGYWDNIVDTSFFPDGANLRLFKSGIEPMWEDPSNTAGGKWTLMVHKDQSSTIVIRTLLALIGEQLEYSIDICGFVLSVRSNRHIISVWNKSGDNQEIIDKTTSELSAFTVGKLFKYGLHKQVPNSPSLLLTPKNLTSPKSSTDSFQPPPSPLPSPSYMNDYKNLNHSFNGLNNINNNNNNNGTPNNHSKQRESFATKKSQSTSSIHSLQQQQPNGFKPTLLFNTNGSDRTINSPTPKLSLINCDNSSNSLIPQPKSTKDLNGNNNGKQFYNNNGKLGNSTNGGNHYYSNNNNNNNNYHHQKHNSIEKMEKLLPSTPLKNSNNNIINNNNQKRFESPSPKPPTFQKSRLSTSGDQIPFTNNNRNNNSSNYQIDNSTIESTKESENNHLILSNVEEEPIEPLQKVDGVKEIEKENRVEEEQKVDEKENVLVEETVVTTPAIVVVESITTDKPVVVSDEVDTIHQNEFVGFKEEKLTESTPDLSGSESPAPFTNDSIDGNISEISDAQTDESSFSQTVPQPTSEPNNLTLGSSKKKKKNRANNNNSNNVVNNSSNSGNQKNGNNTNQNRNSSNSSSPNLYSNNNNNQTTNNNNNTSGMITANIEWGDEALAQNQKLQLYSDNERNWGRIMSDSHLSCYEKRVAATYIIDVEKQKTSQNYTIASQQRDRWWYFFFSNCNTSRLLIPEYEIILTNPGGFWDKHLSADQQSIPQAQIFFIVFVTLLLGVCITEIHLLYKNGLETKSIKMLAGVVSIKILSLLLLVINWGAISSRGSEIKHLDFFGNIIAIVGHSLFILLLLFIAQGWSISIYDSTRVEKAITCIIVSGITIANWVFYTFDYYFSDSYSTYVYFYDSVPGYILLGFFLCLFFYFCLSIFRTYKKQNDVTKKRFYLMFGLVFGVWFIALPIVVIVSHFMDPWVRYKVITILNLVIDIIFYMAVIVVFRPFKSNPWVQILNSDEKLGDKAMKIRDNKDNKEENNNNINNNNNNDGGNVNA
eukprot:gene6612-8183_t